MTLIPNLARIRQMMVAEPSAHNDPNAPPMRTNYGQLIEEAFEGVQNQLNNLSGQTNGSLEAQQNSPPPALNAIQVDGGAGIYHIYLTDNNQNLYRGAEYTAYYSTKPDFSDWHPVHMGPARDMRVNLGIPGPLYWAAHHGYGPASPPSPLIYFGGANPIPVSGAGASAPGLRPGQGSGTNFPTQPPGGYGLLPYRGSSPPRRGDAIPGRN